ncbi:MAG: LysR family transcriptional regulator [Lachnospiraceae bacterium]|nr:LysR family transcriptional regulator [Lachnospiraceae bacterium]
MNIHNLEYFLAIKEERNITKAADRLHITQQSLSEQLKKMENELGIELVSRGRPITLTPAGETFSNGVEQILNIYNETLESIKTLSGDDKKEFTLAVPITDMLPFLPGLLTAFSEEFPDYHIRTMRIQPKEASKYAREFDLYFATLPLGSDLEHIPVLEGDSYAVAISSILAKRVYGERWANVEAELLNKKDISILREVPFILLRNKMDDVVLDQKIIFQEGGFEPTVAFQSESGELNSTMCTLGRGAYVATMEYCTRRFHDKARVENGMLLYPISTKIDPIVIALSYRKGKRLTKTDRTFINFTKNYLQETAVRKFE